MRVHESERNGSHGMAAAAREVVDHAVSIGKLELRLALTEVRRRLAMAGVGVGLAAGAVVFGMLALVLAVATVAAAVAIALPVWAALLILFGACSCATLMLAVTAARLLRRAAPPVPRQALDEARKTVATLRSNGHP